MPNLTSIMNSQEYMDWHMNNMLFCQRLKKQREAIRQDDLIDKFLKGQMTKEEENSFMNELKENPEFKDRAITTAYLVKALRR